jgi:hypothetical protein
VRRGKQRGAGGDLVGMLTDGRGVEGRPESGRRRSSGWPAARGSATVQSRARHGRWRQQGQGAGEARPRGLYRAKFQ